MLVQLVGYSPKRGQRLNSEFLLPLFISQYFYDVESLVNNLNYTSILNIREATKFYNLGNKTFETDFSWKKF